MATHPLKHNRLPMVFTKNIVVRYAQLAINAFAANANKGAKKHTGVPIIAIVAVLVVERCAHTYREKEDIFLISPQYPLII